MKKLITGCLLIGCMVFSLASCQSRTGVEETSSSESTQVDASTKDLEGKQEDASAKDSEDTQEDVSAKDSESNAVLIVENNTLDFVPYYSGFHVRGVDEKPFLEGSVRAGLIADEQCWNAWLKEYAPELEERMTGNSDYNVNWSKEYLLVYVSQQVSDMAVVSYAIDTITIRGSEIAVTEKNQDVAVIAADANSVYYTPYEIVRVSKEDIPQEVAAKYFTAEPEAEENEIPFTSIYRGFHSTVHGAPEFKNPSDYTNGTGEGVVAILKDEESWDSWWNSNVPDLGTHIMNRAMFFPDWENECLLIYHAKQSDEAWIEQHAIDTITCVDGKLVIQEGTDLLQMPVNQEVYKGTWQPIQIVAIQKSFLPEELLE